MTAREQANILSAPDLAILYCAIHNDHTYNLGAIIALRLHNNLTKGKIHVGIYATRLARCFHVPIHPHDYLLPRSPMTTILFMLLCLLITFVITWFLVRIHVILFRCLHLLCLTLMPGMDTLLSVSKLADLG